MKIQILSIAWLLGSIPAYAEVNLRNGNFFITYDDIIIGDIKISRTYNSKSAEAFEFGVGWGYEFASHVSLSPDGVTLKNNGSGKSDYLLFQDSRESISGNSAKTAAALIRKRMGGGLSGMQEQSAELTQSKESREVYEPRGFAVEHKVDHRIFSGDIALEQPNSCGNTGCQLAHGGYSYFTEGSIFKGNWDSAAHKEFSSDGIMLGKADGKSLPVKIIRTDSGKIEMIRQGASHIRFFYDTRGNLSRLVGSNGKEVEIQIDEAGDLVSVTDVTGNTYKYTYQGNHNLVGITYIDGSMFRISYDSQGFCSSTIGRNGYRTDYDYGADPADPNCHYWARVDTIPPYAPASRRKMEYFSKLRSGGVLRISRTIEVLDSVEIISDYDDSGLLVSTTSDASAAFNKEEANGDGMIPAVKGPVHHYRMTYDPNLKFLTRMEITRADGSGLISWNYSYSTVDGSSLMTGATDGRHRLGIVTEGEVSKLQDSEGEVLVKEGRVSADGESWYQVEFRRDSKDGPLRAKLTDEGGKAASVPPLEGLLNRYRLVVGVSARQFLPKPLHGVWWHSYDL